MQTDEVKYIEDQELKDILNNILHSSQPGEFCVSNSDCLKQYFRSTAICVINDKERISIAVYWISPKL